MALFKILKGKEKDLPSAKHEGWAYVTETGNMYVDISNLERVKIGNTADKLGDKVTAGNNLKPVYFKNGLPAPTNGGVIPLVTGTQTAATNVWVGPLAYEDGTYVTPYDGLMIKYYLPYAGTGTGATLQLGPGQPAYPVYRLGRTTQITTHFAAGSIISMTFRASYNVSGTNYTNAWIVDAYYDSNSYAYVRQYESADNIEYPLLARYANAAATNSEKYVTEYSRYAKGVTVNPSTNTITADKFVGTASKATSDALGNNIASTYIKNLGFVTSSTSTKIRQTRGDGSTLDVDVPNASSSVAGLVTGGAQTFGGAKTFNNGIVFPTIATWPSVSGETYPIKSQGLSWNGSSDTGKIYYEVQASDKGMIIVESGDDSNAGTEFRNTNTGNKVTIINGTITGALSGNATTSTSTTNDSAGQNIYTTYIKNISFVNGGDITKLRYQKGNGNNVDVNIPNASASVAGLINNAAQTLAGTKTFSGGIIVQNGSTGFNFSTIGAGSDNVARNVWFSHSSQKGTPVYDDDFKYNPSTNTLIVPKVDGLASKATADASGNTITTTYIKQIKLDTDNRGIIAVKGDGSTVAALKPYFAASSSFGGAAISAQLLNSLGRKTFTASSTAAGTTADEIPNAGISMYEQYGGANSPISYGNILAIRGNTPGGGELLLGWSGTDSTTEHIYYRSHRDANTGGWGAWKKIIFADDKIANAEYADKANGDTTTIRSTYVKSIDFIDTNSDAPKLRYTKGDGTTTPVALPIASASVSGVITRAAQTFAGTKTFNGGIITRADSYKKNSGFGLDLKNSDIIGMNSLYYADVTDSASEGLHYMDSAGTYRTLWASGDGTLYWTNAHAAGAAATQNYTVVTSNNFSNYDDYIKSVAWTNGTTAGPTGTITRQKGGTVSIPAIPSASDSQSGIITTGTQTFGGNKTFNNNIFFANITGATGTTGTALRGIYGQIGDNDGWRIAGGSTASDAGFLEIATCDNGTEPIYVRQYTGGGNYTGYAAIARTLTLLDGSGDTKIPGHLWDYQNNELRSSYFIASLSAASGNSGTYTGISGKNKSGDVISTYQIPNASTSAAGVVTNAAQTFAGDKTFNNWVKALTGFTGYHNAQYSISGQNTNTYPWRLFASTPVVTGSYNDYDAFVMIKGNYHKGAQALVRISLRSDNLSNSGGGSASITYIYNSGVDFRVGFRNDATSVYADFFVKSPGSWPRAGIWIFAQNGNWTFYSSSESTDSANPVNAYASIEAAATAIRGKDYSTIGVPTYVGLVNRANSAADADKATSDSGGRKISSTYAVYNKFTFSGSTGTVVRMTAYNGDGSTATSDIPAASTSVAGIVTTGAQTLKGAKTFNDTIRVKPSTNDYTQGIRIYPYQSWSELVLGGDGLGETGTNANTWAFTNNNGKFTIAKNGNTASDGGVFIHNNGGKWSINTTTSTYDVNVKTFICDSWVRTKGDTGWQSETHGGGWYMKDSNYIRNWGNKKVSLNAELCFENASAIHWNDGAYKQRLFITDDSTKDTPVFTFQQSENSGTSYNNLFTIYDNGKVTFPGELYFDDTSGRTCIRVDSHDKDTVLLRVQSNANDHSNRDKSAHGFSFVYTGASNEDNNRFIVRSDNRASANQVDSVQIFQAGDVQVGPSLGIGGKDVGYKFYVNGTSRFVNKSRFENTSDYATENNVAINFRPQNSGYYTTMSYQTYGNEALVFATKAAVTSFMFINGEDSITNHDSDRWNSITPALQIKNNCISIGERIAHGVTPTYKLKTVGSSYFNGDVYVRTAAGTAGLYVLRESTNESVKHYIDDNTYHLDYTNDETFSQINFRFNNTDTESGGGANKSDRTFYLTSTGQFYQSATTEAYGSIGLTNRWWKEGFIERIKSTYLALGGANIDTSYSLSLNGSSVFKGQVYINYSQDVGLNQNGSLIIGNKAGVNIGIDDNEIMARNNSKAAILYLNNEGGLVKIGSDGLESGGNVYPAITNSRTLGTTSLRWKALYVGAADTYGSTTQPVYWNAGVPTVITSYSGNAATATELRTARNITVGAKTNSFNGTSNITFSKYDIDIFPTVWLDATVQDNVLVVNDANDQASSIPDGKIISIIVKSTPTTSSSLYLNYNNMGNAIIYDVRGYTMTYARARSGYHIVLRYNATTNVWNSLSNPESQWPLAINNTTSNTNYYFAGTSNSGDVSTNTTYKNTSVYFNGSTGTITANGFVTPSTVVYGKTGLEYFNHSATTTSGAATAQVNPPGSDWWHHLRMNHGNSNGYYVDLAWGFHVDSAYMRRIVAGSDKGWKRIWIEGNSVTSAVWNDYAECRQSDLQENEFGYVVMEKGDDTLTKTTKRLQHFAGVSSDTWGFSQGETEKAKTPIAVAGRVLVYPYQDRKNYNPGDCVCAAPGGTVDIMTRDEILMYPDRIVGTVSCVPNYEEWGGGEGADRPAVRVNKRIWIKVK